MFERYTEKARRTIFFARYEAARLGSPYIETEHLLLGLLREDRALLDRLPAGAAEQIRERIQERVPQPIQRGTSVDLPLSMESKRALTYAADDSQALAHQHIDCCHLLLGILRFENSIAVELLREFGIEYASYREEVAKSARQPASTVPVAVEAAGPLAKAAGDLRRTISLAVLIREHGPSPLKRTGWTRKEALGHLVDWAGAHHQWFARALTGPKLAASGYPEDGWLSAQRYDELSWRDLVNLCVSLNELIVHVIARIPAEKLDTLCRIGVAEPIPLQELVHRYVAHCEDVVAQLLMRG
ncbi:MAG TPA: Clp protease N-terminal domain-containing protein [Bryobacteraceae bacterium]|nr:Clp protease N-terminal domain-containing protein [Bryobacteraceae bacterium]